MTLRPQAPSSDGKSVLRSASPSAPGTFCDRSCTISWCSSAPQPGRPITSAEYFSRADCPPENNWSWARGISVISGYMIRPRMPRWILLAILLLVVLGRSAILVFWPGAHFDSDQAVTGLMAKHLAELRAFPVFWYGQTYLLGVEAWLAAPLMAVFGATVIALKLP